MNKTPRLFSCEKDSLSWLPFRRGRVKQFGRFICTNIIQIQEIKYPDYLEICLRRPKGWWPNCSRTRVGEGKRARMFFCFTIIPAVGRPSFSRTVESVLSQEFTFFMGGAWTPVLVSLIKQQPFFQLGGFNPAICAPRATNYPIGGIRQFDRLSDILRMKCQLQ